MCIAPNTLANGTLVACHECWQCRERAINDWVGRNIAESKTAGATFAITLTYGRNSSDDVIHERTVILTYSDVQKYLKLLRFNGHKVRYFVTGEFGSKNNRAHWHIMLYFKDSTKLPEYTLNENFMEKHWPHGWSFWTLPTKHAVRYNCKYIQKDMGDDLRQGHLAMSKKPPLGFEYFCNLAERYVEQGLSPQTLEYKFPDVTQRKKNGTIEVVPFRLKDRPAELFLDHFIATWKEVHGHDRWPNSELVDLYVEYGRIVVDEDKIERRAGGRDLHYRGAPVNEEDIAKALARIGARDEDDVWNERDERIFGKLIDGQEEQQERQVVFREHVRAWVFYYVENVVAGPDFNVPDEYVEEYFHGTRPGSGGVLSGYEPGQHGI